MLVPQPIRRLRKGLDLPFMFPQGSDSLYSSSSLSPRSRFQRNTIPLSPRMGQTSSSPNGRYGIVTIWNPATGRGWITPDRGGNNIPVCTEHVRPGQSLCLGKGVMYVVDRHGRAIEVGDRTGWVSLRLGLARRLSCVS